MWSSTKRRVIAVAAVAATCGTVSLFNALVVRTGPAADPKLIASAASTLIALAAVAAEWPRSRAYLLPIAVGVSAISLAATMLHHPVRAEQDAFWIITELLTLCGMTVVVARFAPARHAAISGSALMVAAASSMLRVTPRALSLELLGSLLTWSFAGALAVALGIYLRNLDDRRARHVDQARRAQRLAVAHDLHDFVAHDVTGMVVQAQAAHLVAQADPAAAIAALPRIEQAGLRALTSLDRTVHTLQELGVQSSVRLPQQEQLRNESEARREFGLEDLLALIGRFAATDSAAVDVDIANPAALSALWNLAYRVTLEALTNVRRHAPVGAAVRIHVRQSADSLMVMVTNDYSVTSEPKLDRAALGAERPSYGLSALRETVRLAGGTIYAGPSSDNAYWEVRAVIPAHAPEAV